MTFSLSHRTDGMQSIVLMTFQEKTAVSEPSRSKAFKCEATPLVL